MPEPQLEETTEILRGEACIQPDGTGYEEPTCETVYVNEETGTHTIFPDSPSGDDEIPDRATIEYYGHEHDAELCFRYQENGATVPALCWE